MKTCLGCVVILLIIVGIFLIPWGSINWGETVCGIINIVAWSCVIGGFVLYVSALAEYAKIANPHPIIAFFLILFALTRPQGIGGVLLFGFGLFVGASFGTC